MSIRPTSLTGAAGEHYVAFQLTARGFSVALTRGGAPVADILVTNLKGNKTIAIQVKTSNWAYRPRPRKKDPRWEWDVGIGGTKYSSRNLYYAFVDLKDWNEGGSPDVFFVKSEKVANWLNPKWRRIMYWIMYSDKDTQPNNWNLIEKALGGSIFNK